MYQKIVVPIDNSDTAAAAFDHALALAQLAKSELILLHVSDISRATIASSVMPGLDLPSYDEQRDRVEGEIQAMLDRLSQQAQSQGIACSNRLIEQRGGNAADALLKAAALVHADLIVMGTHGYSGFMNLIFGSMAESLLHRTTIPVLLVRLNEDDDE